MIIKTLELKNIKSYTKETLEFSEGVNGICGENGNGKTTVLEAIGYALFDFLPFNHADFLRHGEKSGYVAVTVEGKDEIEYTIFRKLGSSSDYMIRTPVGEIKGKKDVMKWLAGNMARSVKSEEELPGLFENAIGVPQGTFTTAFLEPARTRKIIFDNILKVEEYKTAYDNLLPVINAIKKTIEEMEKGVIPLRTRSEKYAELKMEKESLNSEIEELNKQILEFNSRISILASKRQSLMEKKALVDALNAKISNQRVILQGLCAQLEKSNSDLSLAQSAKQTINELSSTEEEFGKKVASLRELNAARLARDKLREEILTIDLTISRLNDKLNHMQSLLSEIKNLEDQKLLLIPVMERARKLEEEILNLKKNLKEPLTDIISRISNLREKKEHIEDMKREIAMHNKKMRALVPLKEKQVDMENMLKDLKDSEHSLRKLSIEITTLKEKETKAEKLGSEIKRLKGRKSELLPYEEKQKALEIDIQKTAILLNSLTELNFQLKHASEKEGRHKQLSKEILSYESDIASLTPMIEKQAALETTLQDLNSRHESVKSLLHETRKKMKMAGSEGMCPVFDGIKCSSVGDFTQYFNNEINSRNNQLKEIKRQMEHYSSELFNLHNPKKQQEEKLVLMASRKKDLESLKDVEQELNTYRERISHLSLLYPSFGALTGSSEELNAISQKLHSCKIENEGLMKSVREFENISALLQSKIKDLDEVSDLSIIFTECQQELAQLNNRFRLDVDMETVSIRLEAVTAEIKSEEENLKCLNNPASKIEIIESLISSRLSDIESLKEVPPLIEDCLKELELLNQEFHLKDSLAGDKHEIQLASDLIESKEKELIALNFPEKEYEKFQEIIKRNGKELKTLESVPGLLKSESKNQSLLKTDMVRYEGLDEQISVIDKEISILEPMHTRYLQVLPLALRIDEYTLEVQTLEVTKAKEEASFNESVSNYEMLSKEFKESELNETILKYDELVKTVIGMSEAVKQQSNHLEKLARNLAEMESIIRRIREMEGNLKKEKDFLSFTAFVRDTIKSSSEFVIKEFIGEISSEANSIYCEIMDDHRLTLRWTNDYDIEIESDGDISSYRQLSGGERMSAALSVRLALLKSLSNCDFVFLDEPTQNMDETRRENLSEQISKIKGFKQVFVISHDDTFNEKYAHVIKLKKINGESRIESCST